MPCDFCQVPIVNRASTWLSGQSRLLLCSHAVKVTTSHVEGHESVLKPLPLVNGHGQTQGQAGGVRVGGGGGSCR